MTSEALQVRTQRLSTKGRKKKMSRAEPPLSRRVSLNLHQDAERRMYPSFPHGTSRRLHRGRRAGGAIEKKPPTARVRQPRETGTQQVTICFGGRRVAAAARASAQSNPLRTYRIEPLLCVCASVGHTRSVVTLSSVMILPQVHLRKPCYDFYFL